MITLATMRLLLKQRKELRVLFYDLVYLGLGDK